MRRRPIPVTGAASGTDEEAMAIVWPERPFSAYVGEFTKMTSVIVGGARTPMGRLLGNLKSFPATALGAAAIKAALERGGVSPEQVQDAIALADQLIRAGEFDIVVAGGMESMTKAPHLLAGQREGYKYGEVTLLDHMAFDGLTDAYDGVSMGESTDRHTKRYGISREEQDAFGAASHQKAAAAQKNGAFAEEITPLPVPQKRGEPVVINEDEGIRPDTTPETLAKLRPAFGADGTITAGTSSPISDGAAAVVVMSETRARQLGLTWLAEIGSHGNVAGPDNSLHSQPARAITQALGKAGLSVDDLDLIEINEAFAAVGVQSTKELGVRPDIVNVNGGAIALGHPIGMSGARLELTLALELKRRGGGLGAAALCGGGGQGDALLIRVPGD